MNEMSRRFQDIYISVLKRKSDIECVELDCYREYIYELSIYDHYYSYIDAGTTNIMSITYILSPDGISGSSKFYGAIFAIK